MAVFVFGSACTAGPNVAADVEINGGDVMVNPVVSGRIGVLGVVIRP